MLICKEVKFVHATLSISLVCLSYGGSSLTKNFAPRYFKFTPLQMRETPGFLALYNLKF